MASANCAAIGMMLMAVALGDGVAGFRRASAPGLTNMRLAGVKVNPPSTAAAGRSRSTAGRPVDRAVHVPG